MLILRLGVLAFLGWCVFNMWFEVASNFDPTPEPPWSLLSARAKVSYVVRWSSLFVFISWVLGAGVAVALFWPLGLVEDLGTEVLVKVVGSIGPFLFILVLVYLDKVKGLSMRLAESEQDKARARKEAGELREELESARRAASQAFRAQEWEHDGRPTVDEHGTKAAEWIRALAADRARLLEELRRARDLAGEAP